MSEADRELKQLRQEKEVYFRFSILPVSLDSNFATPFPAPCSEMPSVKTLLSVGWCRTTSIRMRVM